MKIVTFIGGISKDSLNKKLFELIKPLAPGDFEFDLFDIAALPFFSQDLENNLPEPVKQMKEKVINADAVLFITPEYNRSVPGVLKNAVDWGSRPTGQGVWKGKPGAVLGASPGGTGTLAAQLQLKGTLSFLGAYIMYQPELLFSSMAHINDKGELEDKSKQFFQKFFESFKKWIEQFIKI